MWQLLRIAKQMVRDRQDVSATSCVKDEDGINLFLLWFPIMCVDYTDKL